MYKLVILTVISVILCRCAKAPEQPPEVSNTRSMQYHQALEDSVRAEALRFCDSIIVDGEQP